MPANTRAKHLSAQELAELALEGDQPPQGREFTDDEEPYPGSIDAEHPLRCIYVA
jgi:hypothetical protein